jgi:hypothetical protein
MNLNRIFYELGVGLGNPFRVSNPICEDIDDDEEELERLYQQSVHPKNKEFWDKLPSNKEHPYGNHPLMALYGKKKSRQAFDRTRQHAERAGSPSDMATGFGLMQNMQQIESQHSKELEELAVNVAIEFWAANDEQAEYLRNTIDARLTNGQPTMRPQKKRENIPPMQDLSPKLQQAINKRITMNALTQGSAVDAMMSMLPTGKGDERYNEMQKDVGFALSMIDNNLSDLYSKFIPHAHMMYWSNPQAPAEVMQHQAIGHTEVTWGEDGEARIVAVAANFPVLVQEINKGIMELLGGHALSGLNAEELNVVYSYADRMEDEHWSLQVGQSLWAKFLDALPAGAPVASIISKLGGLDAAEINKIMMAVIDDPQQGKRLAASLVEPTSLPQDKPSYEPSGWKPEDDEDNPDTSWLDEIEL